MEQKLLIISPVRNEADHLELVARSMAGQTRPPDAWLLVDDHSDDGTLDLARRLAAEFPFISVVEAPDFPLADPRDRLASAAAPRTFNAGLATVDWHAYTHIAKFDGDMELPPEYLERILAEFVADPKLGMAGGLRKELVRDKWRLETVPTEHHVNGALKLYSRQCFEAIDGLQEQLGWDTIDETRARMHGYRTRTFTDLVTIHHRPWASADGTLRGRCPLRRRRLHPSLPHLLGGAALAEDRHRSPRGDLRCRLLLRLPARRRPPHAAGRGPRVQARGAAGDPRPGAGDAEARGLMCGIAGQARGERRGPVAAETVAAMCAAQEHRGPDSRGLHVEGPVGLGIQRLRGDRRRHRRPAALQRGPFRRRRPERRDLQLRASCAAT